MKQILILFILLLTCPPLMAQQRNTNKKLMIINGMFFHEMPEQMPADIIITTSMLKDSAWGNIAVYNYPQELSEAAKELAIPVENIKNGKEILEKSKSARKFQTKIANTTMNVKIGDSFPSFTLYDINGRKWSNKDLTGKKAVVNFWYTGCGPCIKEMPELGTWVQQYPDVVFLAITFESADKIKKIVADKKFYFHQLVNDEELMKKIGVNQFPFTLVLNEKGKIIHIETGTSPTQRANILKALK
ncbi:MAG: TlpA family protein disulfide reductase [Bacteroidaceae bacterium]|nr:TlpA family protein disulfide reductase [Bacteroidaceae bacterium]